LARIAAGAIEGTEEMTGAEVTGDTREMVGNVSGVTGAAQAIFHRMCDTFHVSDQRKEETENAREDKTDERKKEKFTDQGWKKEDLSERFISTIWSRPNQMIWAREI
jgi:hypothetical protein